MFTASFYDTQSTEEDGEDADEGQGTFLEFWEGDLVWPDPLGVFEPTSGIKPHQLATPIAGRAGAVSTGVDKTPCDKVMDKQKPPRPKDLPWNISIIKSDPPSVREDELEEFLVHDPLFVEFFNAFLSLPSFPEPICFNVETGGFEVVSDGKQKLSQQIKEAVRSQNLTAKMYRVARQHAFSNIPLIPIEDTQGPEEVKIDTSYEVTTLNKDQGIYWIRAERLPIFLESDFYFTYRLAKVISQARIFNDNGEFVVMKLDYTPRPKKVKTSVEVPPPNMEDVIMKEMFVSFGNVRGEAKEAWFTEAKEHLRAQPTFTSLGPRVTSGIKGTEGKLEPRQKSSVFHSSFFGVYSPGLCGPGQKEPPIQDDDLLNEKLFTPPPDRPFTPRPSDKSFAATDKLRYGGCKTKTSSDSMVNPGPVVKMWPKQAADQDAESGIGEGDERDEDFERRMQAQTIIDQIYRDGSWEEGVQGNIVLRSVDDMGSLIVGAVMKKTLSHMLKVEEEKLNDDPFITSLYPAQDLLCVTTDKLDLCVVVDPVDLEFSMDEFKKPAPSAKMTPTTKPGVATTSKPGVAPTSKPGVAPPDSDSNGVSKVAVLAKDPPHIKWDKPMKKPAEEESDADSLLDSDEDFEERDIHFRRDKYKWHGLSSLKGISSFRDFLKGTPGEKYWALWIDVDKGHLISDEEEERRFVMSLREKYYRQGAYHELSAQDKKKLGLDNLSNWVPTYLFQVQGRILEPLVLYWAPRYLLKNMMHSEPEKHPLYNQLKSLASLPQSDAQPHTQALLPLRPKTCRPRTGPDAGVDESIRRSKTALYRQEPEVKTSPMVGNRRVYGEDTLQRLALTPTAKYLGLKPPAPPATDRGLTSAGPASPHRRTPSARSTSRGSEQPDVSDAKSNADKNKPSGRLSSASVNSSVYAGSKRDDKGIFVGKLAGVPVSKSQSNEKSTKMSVVSKPSSANRKATPQEDCLCKPLTAVLGDTRDEQMVTPSSLTPAKKPRDLLTPMLRIKSSKAAKTKRIASAPVQRAMSVPEPSTLFYRQDSQDSSKACDQRPEAPVQVADMWEQDWLGSDRMEFLLQALHHEQDSGRTFRKYIEKSEKKDWVYNLNFWEMVQQYRQLFYIDKLDLFAISKQAKAIFAQFIVEGSRSNIGVSDSIELQVMERLNPAFEDLFDEAEEHALRMLFGAFQLYLRQDVKTYCKVERAEIMRRLETKNTYILNLQKKGIIKEGPLTPDDPMEGYIDPVCDESILERIPEQFRDWNLEKLLHNRLELEHFRQYLADNYAEMDLKCWMDIEAWRRTSPQDSRKRDQRARDIKKNYLNRRYFFGPSSPAGKEGQNKVMEVGGGWGKFLEDKPASSSILEAQKYVQERLEKKHLPFFLLTRDFQARQSPKLSMADSADDVVVQKKRRSQAVLKVGNKLNDAAFHKVAHRVDEKHPSLENLRMAAIARRPKPRSRSSSRRSSVASVVKHLKLPDINLQPLDTNFLQIRLLESKWVSSAKEVFMFQRALTNPITCKLFQKYVATKGDNLENDLLFWIEVQNYKRMHHTHTEDSLLAQKIGAILHCFIDSTIPPSLQIDVPQEMADRILDHKHEKGPYLFREAQLATFRILLSHWQPFCEFRNNMDSYERAMKTLERHKIQARKKEQEYRDKMDKQKEKERLLRLELGLGENEELPDDLFEDEEDKGDKIAFSYSGYLEEMKKHVQTEDESFDLTMLQDNTSQTVRDASGVKP